SGIKASSRVVGRVRTRTGPNGIYVKYQAAVWTNGTWAGLSTGTNKTEDSFGNGINDSGDMAGQLNNAATLWHNGIPAALTTPGGTKSSSANAINDSGEVVGQIIDKHWNRNAALWKNGSVYNMGVLH